MLFWTIIFIFILCEPGAKLTYQFDTLSGELIRYDWYLLTIEMQRMYMFFLLDTQHPMKMLCYGNITCERDTTKKVFSLLILVMIRSDRGQTDDFEISIIPIVESTIKT